MSDAEFAPARSSNLNVSQVPVAWMVIGPIPPMVTVVETQAEPVPPSSLQLAAFPVPVARFSEPASMSAEVTL